MWQRGLLLLEISFWIQQHYTDEAQKAETVNVPSVVSESLNQEPDQFYDDLHDPNSDLQDWLELDDSLNFTLSVGRPIVVP